jgi:hypothetical protein
VESQAGEVTVANTLMAPAQALTKTPAIVDAIEKGFNGVLEVVPPLMKALDEVAKVHPFIAGTFVHRSAIIVLTILVVVVLAFKAVYTLETIRHGNDTKVTSLYMEMRDMMSVLIQSGCSSVLTFES